MAGLFDAGISCDLVHNHAAGHGLQTWQGEQDMDRFDLKLGTPEIHDFSGTIAFCKATIGFGLSAATTGATATMNLLGKIRSARPQTQPSRLRLTPE
jgi:hypothetical protein